MRRSLLGLTISACVFSSALGTASVTQAFSVKSGLTDGCHERVTLAGYLQARSPLPQVQIPVPEGDWEEVADYLLQDTDYQPVSRQEKFLVFSLFAGIRAPDNEGFSLTNISVLRAIHANPEGQYDHCLRAAEDDGLEGDSNTAEGCRESVRSQLRKAREVLDKPEADQILSVKFTLDTYGAFDVDVWGVAYHVARSLHVLQDSFTHTLRTPDLRRIIHYMNYVEAIEGTLEESRDGLPHSGATDACTLTSTDPGHPHNADRTFAATEATADLFRAASRVLQDDDAAMQDVEVVIDKWLGHEDGSGLGYPEGCTKDNDYCDSQWLAQARLHPSGPIFGCGVAGPIGARQSGGGLSWLAPCLLLALRRRR